VPRYYFQSQNSPNERAVRLEMGNIRTGVCRNKTDLKQMLTSDPVLKLFDIKKSTCFKPVLRRLHGTLLQKEVDGTLHPVFLC